MNKDIHPVDRLVGQRVRLLRVSRGMSQSTLAAALDLTFQQVQKYEKGTNRISASKLYEIAKVLNVSLASLFEDAGAVGDDTVSTNGHGDGRRTRVDNQIISKLALLPNDRLKRQVLDLISTLTAARAQLSRTAKRR